MREIFEKSLGKYSSGYSIAILHNKRSKVFNMGRLSYDYDGLIDDETLFDIASLSKTFTAILIFLAVDDGKITFESKVKEIDTSYENIGQLTISDLLAHRQEVWTPGHIKHAKSKEEIIDLLNKSYILSSIPQYSDVHYMVLGRILESIYNKPYEDIILEKIRDDFKISSLTYRPKGMNVVDTRFENDINDKRLNLPHDPKSRLAIDYDMVLGHAGIFISSKDLLKFLSLLINKRIIKGDLYNRLLEASDYKHPDNLSNNISTLRNLPKNYCLMGARLKDPININNEIPLKASSSSVYFSGYTGPAYFLDFKNKDIILLMSNVTHRAKAGRLERKDHNRDLIWKVYDMYIKSSE